MEKQQLVELVTNEVLRRLEERATAVPARNLFRYQALAIITGGTIGLEKGLEELSTIQAMGTNLTVVLSETAEKIIGVKRIKDKLGNQIKLVTAQLPYPKEDLSDADVVLVPVLTQNSAAKLAATISDTMATYLILSALMQNKPVIAAIDAADPEKRPHVKMTKLSSSFRNALENNLVKIGTYGITLTTVERLASETKKLLIKEGQQQMPINQGKKPILDAEAVRNAAENREKVITIPAETIVTPLALDLARDFKIDIVHITSI